MLSSMKLFFAFIKIFFFCVITLHFSIKTCLLYLFQTSFPAFFDIGSNIPSSVFPDNVSHNSHPSSQSSIVYLSLPSQNDNPIPGTRSKRQTNAPAYLDQYHCYLLDEILSIPLNLTHTKSYPISAFCLMTNMIPLINNLSFL